MSLKVIGAGIGRTGTLSLKAALEELGFGRCYHMIELLTHPEHVDFWEDLSRGRPVNWDAFFVGYQAAVDFPAYRFYKELLHQYPDAKVLLTVRDPQSWYDSALHTIYRAGPGPLAKAMMSVQLPFSPKLRRLVRIFRLANRLVWETDFRGRFEDKEFALRIFQEHAEEVKRVVPPEQLLVYEVREGWEPLCRFLGVPVPEGKPFPWLNGRATFRQRPRPWSSDAPASIEG